MAAKLVVLSALCMGVCLAVPPLRSGSAPERARAEQGTPGWLPPGSVFVETEDPSSTTCTQEFSCLNCTTARVCRSVGPNKWEEKGVYNCSADYPYCDPSIGTCTNEMDATCADHDDDFVCLRDGYFPDPHCNEFHVCTNLVPLKFTCSGLNYDPVTQKCNSRACNTFESCGGPHVQRVAHSGVKKFFGYCVGARVRYVDRCEGSYEWDTAAQECVPVCRGEGLVQDLADCHYYYQCNRQPFSYEYTMQRMQCPAGAGFHPEAFRCVPHGQIPHCL